MKANFYKMIDKCFENIKYQRFTYQIPKKFLFSLIVNDAAWSIYNKQLAINPVHPVW